MNLSNHQRLEVLEDNLIRRYNDLPDDAPTGDAADLLEQLAFVQVTRRTCSSSSPSFR